jgi:hypothetical protein
MLTDSGHKFLRKRLKKMLDEANETAKLWEGEVEKQQEAQSIAMAYENALSTLNQAEELDADLAKYRAEMKSWE